MEEIRYDGNQIIYKWKSEGNNRKKDNAIQWGSSLRVKKGQSAIFTYYKDGKNYTDIIEGPFDQIVDTKNLPIISSIVGLVYKGGTPFPAEVYFLNKQQLIQLKFGVPYFDVFDCQYKEFSVPVAVRGSLNFRVKDTNEFTDIFGLRDLTNEDFKDLINGALTRYIKASITNLPEAANLPVLKMERNIDSISQIIEEVLRNRLTSEFGVELTSLDLSAIEVNKETKDYKDLVKVGKKLSLKTILHKARILRIKDDIEVAEQATDIASKAADIALKLTEALNKSIPFVKSVNKLSPKTKQ